MRRRTGCAVCGRSLEFFINYLINYLSGMSGIGESLAYTNGRAMTWPLVYLWRIHGIPMAYPWHIYIVGNGNINFVAPLS